MNSIPTRNDANDAPAGDDPEADVYVLGGGALGEAVTSRLRSDGLDATQIDDSGVPDDRPDRADDPDYVRALRESGVGAGSTVLVATDSDGRNLLLAQIARAHFGVDRVLVLANEPDRVEVLADAGLDPVCATTGLADALADHV